ncbi:MAG: PAS domain S-box protein [Halodesulfurarchaeum sp.]
MSMESSPIRVLHVDDEQGFAELTADLLAREDDDIAVETVEQPSQALERLSEGDIDCIVSDYDMPDMDWLSFLRAVRQRDPDLPFILFTGKGSEEVASEAISAGVTDYLQKETGTDQYAVLANRIRNAVTRFRAEQSVETERDRFAALFENAPDPMYEVIFDGEQPVIQRANRAFESVFGYDEDAVVGRTVADVLVPEADRQEHDLIRSRVLEGEVVDDEVTRQTESGPRIFRLRVIPFESGEAPARAYAWYTDVTEQKRREAAHRRYEAFLENLPDTAFVFDSEGICTYANESASEQLGIPAEQLTGVSIEDLVEELDAELADRITDDVRALLAGEKSRLRRTLRFDLEDDTHFVDTRSKRVETDDGDFLGIVSVLRDVTDRERRAEGLEAERDRVRALFENTDDAIAYTEFEGDEPIIRDVNPAFERIFGYDADAVVGRSIDEVVVPPDDEALATEINRRVRAGERLENEVRRQTTDGLRDFRLRSVPLHPGESGVQSYAIYSDITEQKRRERELERYEMIVEAAGDPVYTLDEEGQFTFVNDRLAELSGYSKKDLLGAPGEMLVADDDLPAVMDLIDSLRSDPETNRGTLEVELVTAAGEAIPTEIHVALLPGEGTFRGTVGVVRDISDRREREQALASLHRAATDLEGAEDEERVYQTLVDAAEGILDFALVAVDTVEGDALVQQAWTLDRDTEGYFEETPLEEDTFATRAYARQETILTEDLREYDITPADPEYRSALTVPIGEFGTFQAVSRETGAFDESDRELAELLVGHAREALQRLAQERSLEAQRERLRQENERLDEFASVVSHDLRNPLNVAKGHLELLREACESESESVDGLERALDRMGAIIEDVLTLARKGQRVDEAALEPVSLPEMAERCWRNVETADATIRLETEGSVLADRGRLQQVFENLFRNAIEHGGQAVRIEVGDLPDGFYVEDDGPGIDAGVREDVFTLGYSTTEPGTGFGLAIVQGIVQAHGWDIRVTESASGGARFEITGVER